MLEQVALAQRPSPGTIPPLSETNLSSETPLHPETMPPYETMPPSGGPVCTVSMSGSALFLSPCVYWIGQRAYDDRYADTTERDRGTKFHRKIDRWLKAQLWRLESYGQAPF